jgi:hypothetical protein
VEVCAKTGDAATPHTISIAGASTDAYAFIVFLLESDLWYSKLVGVRNRRIYNIADVNTRLKLYKRIEAIGFPDQFCVRARKCRVRMRVN